LLGAFMLYASIYIILLNLTYFSVLIFAVVIRIAYPIINVPYVSMTYDVIGKAREAKTLRVEYIVVREVFVNIGRVVSIVTFLFSISFFIAEDVIPILLLIFGAGHLVDRKSTRLNSSHVSISYAVFCLKKKITIN